MWKNGLRTCSLFSPLRDESSFYNSVVFILIYNLVPGGHCPQDFDSVPMTKVHVGLLGFLDVDVMNPKLA